MRFFLLVLIAISLVSCSRDPQVIKKKYLQSGNTYFDRGKYKEASIMYRRALATDGKYGEAYYRLAMVSLKQGQVANAVPALRRAIELLPKGSKEADDANLNLAEILLLAAEAPDSTVARNRQLIGDVEQIADGFLQQNKNSFEGHKVKGDLLFAQAFSAYKRNEVSNSTELIDQTIAEYRKALEIRPKDPAATLSLARTLGLHGDKPEAERLYRSVIDSSKGSSPAYLELYRLYAGQRRTAEAEAVLKQAIAASPKDYSFQILLAAHYFSTGNKAEGGKMLDHLKANFREFPQAYFTAGDFYMRLNDQNEAVKQYEEGEKKDSAHKVDYQKRIVEVLFRQGKTAQAYEKNLEILKSNPKDPEARGLKASFLIDKGDINQALNELQAVVLARPDNFVARFHLGRAYFAKSDYEQARQQFEKAVELNQNYLPPRLALAQVALARGDQATALRYSQDALKINPQSGAGRLLQSAALMRMQKFQESRSTLDQLLAANPKQPDTLLEVGVLNLMEKKYKDASDVFRRAYEADPSNARGLLGQAESLLLMGQPDQAVKLIDAESKRFPDRVDLRRDLADMEMRTGNFQRAADDYRGLLDKYKDSPRQEAEIWARIGEVYTRQRDFSKAIEAYQKSKDLAPENTAVLNNLALLLDTTGKHSEARKVYEQSISRDPNNPEALNNLAYLMAETGGNLDEALTLATRAKQKLPTLADVSDTIGWIYLKKNLSDNAVDIFKDLTTKVPNNPTYHYHFAMALVQKGDKTSAAKQCQLALANEKNKEEEGRIRDLMSRI